MAHWAFRKLAGMLAREGFHVFRFDYRGTGDSAGRTEDGDPSAWIDDVRAAAAELKDIAGVRAVSLVGMRLGASIAALACAGGLAVRELVLWEPVVNGARYLAELDVVDRRRNLLLLHPRARNDGPRDELFGFPVTPAQRSAIEGIDLCRTGKVSARRVLIVAPDDDPQYAQLRDALAATHPEVQLEIVADEGALDRSGREVALLCNNILVAMTGALAHAR